jgi:hypothetical protein
MTKPIWLVEDDTFYEGNPEKMKEIIAEMGMRVIPYKTIPFGGGLRDVEIKENVPVVMYGSLNAAQYILKKTDYQPGAWCDYEALSCRSYYAHWGKYLLQEEYGMFPLAELPRRKDWLYKIFGENSQIFVRPDSNDKAFTGEVVHYDLFDKWYRLANFYEPGPACLTIVSKPANIKAEYRLVIADREPVAGSVYKPTPVAGCSEEVWNFAREVANSCAFNPHPIYVLDIAETDKGCKVIEMGSVNGAGLYACDLRKVVEKMTEIAERCWKELQP